jgi:hypothetical protein
VQGITGAPLTASLTVKYRGMVRANNVYVVNTQVESITPRDRPGKPSWDVHLTATIFDQKGNTLVEGSAHYVIKQF